METNHTSLKETPEWSNFFAEMSKRISHESVKIPAFLPIEPTDKVFGPVSVGTVRTLAYYFHLRNESARHSRNLTEVNVRPGLVDLIDEVELEMEYVLNRFHLLLHAEIKEWRGLPIFTIREGNVAVIRVRDMRHYEAHARTWPYKPGNTYTLFQDIAHRSIRRS